MIDRIICFIWGHTWVETHTRKLLFTGKRITTSKVELAERIVVTHYDCQRCGHQTMRIDPA